MTNGTHVLAILSDKMFHYCSDICLYVHSFWTMTCINLLIYVCTYTHVGLWLVLTYWYYGWHKFILCNHDVLFIFMLGRISNSYARGLIYLERSYSDKAEWSFNFDKQIDHINKRWWNDLLSKWREMTKCTGCYELERKQNTDRIC